MNITQAAVEMRKVIQYFAQTFDIDTQLDMILEVPSVFPAYAVNVAYKTKEVISYGKNSVGDPQLYQILQDHTSSAEWTPDTATSLYKKIGISEEGYPEWVQPLGATDAYNMDDVVSYKGTVYRSTIDANVWSPELYPTGWEKYVKSND
ncbi:MAG TPA: hypothetical protein IAD34_09175 [Candidatus Scatovicinus merdipullorum]|nr:hypothetical protein [Candidatus Scatovicinus merdipullorum]